MTTSRRAFAAGAVLALHALLWLAWRDPVPPPRQVAAATEPPPLVVRLLWPAPAAARPAQAAPAAPAPPPRIVQPAAPAAPPAAALQVPAAAALPPVAEPAAPASAALPAPPALVLDLPRGASAPRRNPALDDPRSHTAPKTIESRLAAAMARDWKEEVQPDGRVYFRRGDECVVTQPSRDAQLDPYNSSQRPRQAGSC